MKSNKGHEFALVFDVFGTVVDWRGTIIAEGTRLFGHSHPHLDWAEIADAWSRAYGKFASSGGPWSKLDLVLENAFPRVAPGLPPSQEMASVWSRLRPWPDAITGFRRLCENFTIVALTNANVAMLESLAISSGLPWDILLSAESVRRYKPDPQIYQLALRRLGLPADHLVMVASHTFDLNAAKRQGFRTALVSRPSEPGSSPSGLDHAADYIACDLNELAEQLARDIA